MAAGRVLAAALLVLAAVPSAWSGPPVLQWPLACTPNRDCWIANHVDLDPGPGILDYACGALTYEGHNGTDIAIPDRAAMEEGVVVLAAAPGRVRGVRDGVADASVRDSGREAVKDRECGNGVLIDHGEGWETQYCHLRRGSLRVAQSEQVVAGQALGLVGLSGLTEYPHLHLSVRHNGKVVDPSGGEKAGRACPAPTPLWRPDVAAKIPYAPGVVYNAGFAPEIPEAEVVRNGRYRKAATLGATAPVLAFYAEVFGVEPGDALELRVAGPDGRTLLEQRIPLSQRQARRFAAVGKRRGAQPWPAGTYRGEARLVRADGTRPEASARAAEIRIEPVAQ